MIAMESNIKSNLPRTDVGIESVKKCSDGKEYLMILNHKNNSTNINIPGHYIDLITNKKIENEVKLEPYGVVMLLSSY